jgi:hypothetical protein
MTPHRLTDAELHAVSSIPALVVEFAAALLA